MAQAEAGAGTGRVTEAFVPLSLSLCVYRHLSGLSLLMTELIAEQLRVATRRGLNLNVINDSRRQMTLRGREGGREREGEGER